MQRREFLEKMLLTVPGACMASLAAHAAGEEQEHPLPAVDLDFLADGLALVPRSDWTDTDPVYWRMRAAGKYERLTVHHSGARVKRSAKRVDVVAQLDAVLTSHRQRRYGDIGYHFVVDYAGRVWEGRSLAYEGAHVAHENRENLAVMVLGNYETQDPSIRQLSALRTVVTRLCRRFKIEHGAVYGHRDLGASVCPGRRLYPYVRAIRALQSAAKPTET